MSIQSNRNGWPASDQGGEGVDAGLTRNSLVYLHLTRLRSTLRPIRAPAAAPKLPGKTSFFPLFIAVAHAADAGAAQDTPVRFGVRVE